MKIYEYPHLSQTWDEGEPVEKLTYIKHRGRPFQFKREFFINPDAEKNIQYKPDPDDLS